MKNLKIIINFNFPLAPENSRNISMLNYKFENHIEMKKSSSIRELKYF